MASLFLALGILGQVFTSAALPPNQIWNGGGAHVTCSGDDVQPSKLVVSSKLHPLSDVLVLSPQCKGNEDRFQTSHVLPVEMDIWYGGNDTLRCIFKETPGAYEIDLDLLAYGEALIGSIKVSCPKPKVSTPALSGKIPDSPVKFLLKTEDRLKQICGVGLNEIKFKPQETKTIVGISCAGAAKTLVLQPDVSSFFTIFSEVSHPGSDACVFGTVGESSLPAVDMAFFKFSNFEYIGSVSVTSCLPSPAFAMRGIGATAPPVDPVPSVVLNEGAVHVTCSGEDAIPSTLVVSNKLHPLHGVLLLSPECKGNSDKVSAMYPLPVLMDVWYTGNDPRHCVFKETPTAYEMDLDVLAYGKNVIGIVTVSCPKPIAATPAMKGEMPDYPVSKMSDVTDVLVQKCGNESNEVLFTSQSEKTVVGISCEGAMESFILDVGTYAMATVYTEGNASDICVFNGVRRPQVDISFFKFASFEYTGTATVEYCDQSPPGVDVSLRTFVPVDTETTDVFPATPPYPETKHTFPATPPHPDTTHTFPATPPHPDTTHTFPTTTPGGTTTVEDDHPFFFNTEAAYIACSDSNEEPSSLVVSSKLHPLYQHLIMTLHCDNDVFGSLLPSTRDIFYSSTRASDCVFMESPYDYIVQVKFICHSVPVGGFFLSCPKPKMETPPKIEIPEYPMKLVNMDDMLINRCGTDSNILEMIPQAELTLIHLYCKDIPHTYIIETTGPVGVELFRTGNTSKVCVFPEQRNDPPFVEVDFFVKATYQYLGSGAVSYCPSDEVTEPIPTPLPTTAVSMTPLTAEPTIPTPPPPPPPTAETTIPITEPPVDPTAEPTISITQPTTAEPTIPKTPVDPTTKPTISIPQPTTAEPTIPKTPPVDPTIPKPETSAEPTITPVNTDPPTTEVPTQVFNEAAVYMLCAKNGTHLVISRKKLHPLYKYLTFTVTCDGTVMDVENQNTEDMVVSIDFCQRDNGNSAPELTIHYLQNTIGSLTLSCLEPGDNASIPDFQVVKLDNIHRRVASKCGVDYNELDLLPQSERTVAALYCANGMQSIQVESNSLVTMKIFANEMSSSDCLFNFESETALSIDLAFFRFPSLEYIGTGSVSYCPEEEMFILDVTPHCGRDARDKALVTGISDVDADFRAICQDGQSYQFTNLHNDGVNYQISVLYDGDPSKDCVFSRRNNSEIYFIIVHVSWGEESAYVHEHDQEYQVVCTFDARGEGGSDHEDVGEALIAPPAIQHYGDQINPSHISIQLIDVKGEPMLQPSLGRRVRLRAMSDGLGPETGIRPVGCDVIGVSTGRRFAVIRAGCGDGIIFRKREGFATAGLNSTSPYFKTFSMAGDSTIRFECNFTMCSSNCDGDSCAVAGFKQSTGAPVPPIILRRGKRSSKNDLGTVKIGKSQPITVV